MELTGYSLILVLCTLDIAQGFKFTLYDVAKVSWQEAANKCLAADRILARVDTETDKIWVNTLSQYVTRRFWIGLSRRKGDTHFLWTDSAVLDYSNWAEGHPGKETTEDMDCVRIRLRDFKWETYNCSLRLNYLCEDQYHTETYATKKDKEIKGMLLGLCFLFCLLLACFLLLQMPCCSIEKPATFLNLGSRRKGRKDSKRSGNDLLI